MPSPSSIASSANPQPTQSVRPKAPARPAAEEPPDAASGGFAALLGILGMLGDAVPLQEPASVPLPGALETADKAAEPDWSWNGSLALGQGLAALPVSATGALPLGGQASPFSALLPPPGRRVDTLASDTAGMGQVALQNAAADGALEQVGGNAVSGHGLEDLPQPSASVLPLGRQTSPFSGLLLPTGRRAGALVAETARMDSALEGAEPAAGTGRPVAVKPGMVGTAPASAAALAAVAAKAQAKSLRTSVASALAQPGQAAAHGAALAPSALALADSTAAPARLEGAAALAAALRSALDAETSFATAPAALAPAAAPAGGDSAAGGRSPGQGAGGAAGADLSQPAAQAEGAPAVPGSDASAPLPESANTPDAITGQMAYWATDNLQNAELTLAHGGRPVEVSVSLDGQNAHVAFRSDQSDTRALLDAGTGQLRDLLGQEGLLLSGVSVGSSSAQSDAPPRHPQGRSTARQAAVVAAQAATTAGERPQRAGVLTERKVDLFV